MKETLSTDEILKRYFGSTEQVAATLKTAPVDLKTEANERPNPGPEKSNDLTPTGKFIVREAKRRLGEQSAFGSKKALDETELLRLVQTIETTSGDELHERERTAVVAALSASLDHYDIISPLIQNPEVNDIIIRNWRDISIQSGRRNIQTDLRFPDEISYKSFVENLLKRCGKSCTTATPVVDAAIDPHVRACVTHESFSPPGSGPMMTLRIARHRAISLDALVQYGLAPRVILEYLATIAHSGDATILIAGEVGSGKTTLIKALTSRIDVNEAILVIEDTHELVLERKFVRTLLTREANTEGAGRISPAQAIRTGMRMAMNRVILGEMRDAEAAEAFIDVCASGHAGMSTIHARSARDAIYRLEIFLARAQGNVTIETIRRQIANAISVIVFINVDPKTSKRRIYEVLEVGTSSDGAVQVSPMFSFKGIKGQEDNPRWKRDSGISKFQDLLKTEDLQIGLGGETIDLDTEM
ncbi:CpaF family protein [bacterium]|nr:CpaF family protein [bacterium]